MGQIISKNSKKKFGLTPGYTPLFFTEPTGEAVIPLTQDDGSIRYVSPKDIKWMADNGLFEKPKKQST